MKKLSDLIVKKRNLILFVAVLLLILSVIGYAHMKVNYDLLSYLPQDAESMTEQKSLSGGFNLASTGILVVGNTPGRNVLESKKEIKAIDGVKGALWKDDILDISIPKEILPKDVREVPYSDKRTLTVITLQEETSSQRTMDAIKIIRGYADYKCYLGNFSAITEDTKDLMNEEAPLYAVTAIILRMIILSMELESSIAPLVSVSGIVFPIVYNFGADVFLGQTSYITKALALVLQLGVTMDYSILLLHRYQEEKKKSSDRDEAMSNMTQATFTSITSFSITIVAGFLTLRVMQLTLGGGIGIVMAKGVIFGVLSTIIVLPALSMLFNEYIKKWKHPILLKEPKKLPGFLTRHYKTILVAFVVIFIPMIHTQVHTNACYDLNVIVPGNFPSAVGADKLKDQFHMTMTHFLPVDEKLENYETKEIRDSVEELPGVHSVISYENLIGGGIPNELEPAVVKNILQSGGRGMILVNSIYRSATNEEDERLSRIDMILHKYDEHTVTTGEGPLTRDLITTTDIDFKIVNILSVAVIFLVIAITFKSPALPAILVASVEFAICTNMGIPFSTGTTLPLTASVVVGIIQLGAAVDYAILTTTCYKEELSNGSTVIETAREVAAKSAPSIIAPGLSFFAVCIGVSFISKMDLIESLCILISRGTVISILSILLILPAMLIIFHKLMKKTIKGWPKANLK